MVIGLCQIDSQWENKEATKERIKNYVLDLKEKVDCLIFPEMVLTGFSMNMSVTELNTEDHRFFSWIAEQTGSVILYGGVRNKSNCIFMVRPGASYLALYSKRHLFTLGGEKNVYLAGTENKIVEIFNYHFSLAICYDLRFTYHFWKQANNCEGYIIIASWPESRKEHWKTLLRARAIENQAFVIGVNRTGKDPKLTYSGDSLIYDPFGKALFDCGSAEGIFLYDLDLSITNEIRKDYRFIEDRLE